MLCCVLCWAGSWLAARCMLSPACACVDMPRYVVARDEQSQSDSSDEEEQAQEQESDAEENGIDGGDDEQQTAEEAPAAAHDRKKIKLSLKQKQKDVCHVRCRLLQLCMHGHGAATTAAGCVNIS
jgi:hypothetical protein